jgi:hypothetical protein
MIPLIAASQVGGITGLNHHTWPICPFVEGFSPIAVALFLLTFFIFGFACRGISSGSLKGLLLKVWE